MRIGFIGLGQLGRQLVDQLLRSEPEHVVVFDANPAATERYAREPAVIASTILEVVQSDAAIVGVCVQNDEQLREVVEGPTGLLQSGLREGALIAVHSTVHPATCRALAATASVRGVDLIDAAITNGGGLGARRQRRIVLAGGPAHLVEQSRPYLASIGDVVEHAGPLGSGQVVKLLNNLLLTANIGVAAATEQVAASLGADPGVVQRTLRSGSAASQGGQMLHIESSARATANLLRKDVRLASDVIGAAGDAAAMLQQAGLSGVEAMFDLAERLGEP